MLWEGALSGLVNWRGKQWPQPPWISLLITDLLRPSRHAQMKVFIFYRCSHVFILSFMHPPHPLFFCSLYIFTKRRVLYYRLQLPNGKRIWILIRSGVLDPTTTTCALLGNKDHLLPAFIILLSSILFVKKKIKKSYKTKWIRIIVSTRKEQMKSPRD